MNEIKNKGKEIRLLQKRIKELERAVAELKRTETKLLQDKDFSEAALNAQLDTFFVFEAATGKAIRWNQAFKNIVGYTDEEITSLKAPDSYYSPEDLERTPAFIQKVLETGIGRIELELICKNGRKVPTEYMVSMLKDEKSEPKYFISIGRDITERKQAEEQLKTERDTLQRLMDGLATTGIGVDVVGIDYKVLHQNKHLIDAFGDLTGKLCYANYMGLVAPCDPCPMSAAIESGKVESAEMTGRDGRCYLVLSAPLLSPDGVVDKAIEVVLDITERKQAEEELKIQWGRLEDIVKKRTAELQGKNVELERFHDATIDREFRMKELRNQIEELKKKLAGQNE